ncbi:hypothetical protein DEO72_LG3g1696 [Vigna unguiculata]|uniref:Uncharacterized protein n=1 Tax=Vigna unguiculata TaxID=3917 RepID=A0A4D6LEY5_VIGUN|nr:hypothetical protein DEO72_LG3g1696 [Vigna unguiculata]
MAALVRAKICDAAAVRRREGVVAAARWCASFRRVLVVAGEVGGGGCRAMAALVRAKICDAAAVRRREGVVAAARWGASFRRVLVVAGAVGGGGCRGGGKRN